jgi:hypothetical protein
VNEQRCSVELGRVILNTNRGVYGPVYKEDFWKKRYGNDLPFKDKSQTEIHFLQYREMTEGLSAILSYKYL